MTVLRTEVLPIRTASDVVTVRQVARTWCIEQGLSLVEQTKLVTAASELARNTLDYGGGGTARIEALHEGIRRGVRLVFEDRGPGIADVQRALQDGYTTGNGMGLGLGGARRLVNEFSIESEVGVGTRVSITRWK
jgi:serine/threonine-protein kinase RsbT